MYVTGFRGSRKSTVAERISRRNMLFWNAPRYWVKAMKYSVYHVESYEELQRCTGYASDGNIKIVPSSEWKWAYSALFAAGIALLFVLVKSVYSFCVSAVEKHSKLIKDFSNMFWWSKLWAICRKSLEKDLELPVMRDCMPRVATIVLVTVMAFLMRRMLYHVRHPIIIVDDLMTYQYPGGTARAKHVESVLLYIRKIRNVSVMVISSNEGILQFLADKNRDTYNTAVMPPPTISELQHVLGSMGIYATKEDVEAVTRTVGMNHHTLSCRWWADLQAPLLKSQYVTAEWLQTLAKRESDARTGDAPLTIDFMRNIALRLDLEAAEVGRWFALAYSPLVSVRTSLRGYLSTADIDAVVAALRPTASHCEYPTPPNDVKLPRRVVLPLALLAMSQRAALREALRAQAAALRASVEKHRSELETQSHAMKNAATEEARRAHEADVKTLEETIDKEEARLVCLEAYIAANDPSPLSGEASTKEESDEGERARQFHESVADYLNVDPSAGHFKLDGTCMRCKALFEAFCVYPLNVGRK